SVQISPHQSPKNAYIGMDPELPAFYFDYLTNPHLLSRACASVKSHEDSINGADDDELTRLQHEFETVKVRLSSYSCLVVDGLPRTLTIKECKKSHFRNTFHSCHEILHLAKLIVDA
ncbi:hypothetical protein L208DRAFT_1219038, partial [Tricholoma matsutake]